MYKTLGSSLRLYKPGVVRHMCNPNTRGRRIRNLRSSLVTQEVQGQHDNLPHPTKKQEGGNRSGKEGGRDQFISFNKNKFLLVPLQITSSRVLSQTSVFFFIPKLLNLFIILSRAFLLGKEKNTLFLFGKKKPKLTSSVQPTRPWKLSQEDRTQPTKRANNAIPTS